MANLNFNATTVDPQRSSEALEAGWYNVQIVESEMKETAARNGAYLNLSLKVIDGANVGRYIFDRLNLQNQNPVAVEIAYRRLSAYCHATGVMQVQDSQQLHGIPFKVRVSKRVDPNGQYDPSNEVRAVEGLHGATPPPVPAPAAPPPPVHAAPPAPAAVVPPPAPQQPAPAPASQAAPAVGNVPPWMNK